MAAIRKFEEEGGSDVSKLADDIKCPHNPTPCNWSGNGIHYACLKNEEKHPQQVYTQLRSGAFGQIIVEGEKTQK